MRTPWLIGAGAFAAAILLGGESAVHHPAPCSLLLAGECVRFDGDLKPQFTERQIRASAHTTRAGLVKWAATGQGQRLIRYFSVREYEVTVVEEWIEDGVGRAPQPGIATLSAAADRSQMKRYLIIFNPPPRTLKDVTLFPTRRSASGDDIMAAAWAGEMLHVYFYSQGVSLPHHHRPEFQDQWRTVAAELGLPNMPHDDTDDPY